MLSDSKIVILVDNYFEQVELTKPKKLLEAVRARVDIIAAKDYEIQGLKHLEPGQTFHADEILANIRADDYDALLIPGGVFNSDQLRIDKPSQYFVTEMLESGKPVAAICHAPWLLVSAGLVEGRTLTSYHTLQDDIRNAGGKWVDQAVCIDGNLITSRKPDDIPAFTEALINKLTQTVGV